MSTAIMGGILLVVVVAFTLFYRHSRTEAWWESGTRKALLNAMIAAAPFLGMRYRQPRPEPPTISTPAESDLEDNAKPNP